MAGCMNIFRRSDVNEKIKLIFACLSIEEIVPLHGSVYQPCGSDGIFKKIKIRMKFFKLFRSGPALMI
jgi:hypothetical protein